MCLTGRLLGMTEKISLKYFLCIGTLRGGYISAKLPCSLGLLLEEAVHSMCSRDTVGKKAERLQDAISLSLV